MEDTLQILNAGSRFLLTTHELPDGDGLGSQMALHLALRALGKQSWPINPSETPEKFSLVDPQGQIQVYSVGGALPKVDAILVLDTNELKMMGRMEKALTALGAPILFIDHHEPEQMPPGAHFVDESFAATGELVYALIQALGVSLDEAMATALYTAIVTDTAGFRYKRTSPLSHRIAAELLEAGVAPEKVYHAIFARESVAKTRLLGHCLENLKVSLDGKVVWMEVPRKVREAFGATVEDTESFVGFVTLIRGIEFAALFREEEDGRVKVSLRGMGSIPVIEIARALGGGGHRFAAGARVKAPLAEVVQKVLALCQAALPV